MISLKNTNDFAEIALHGLIGSSWAEEGITSSEFLEVLDAIPEERKIVVSINSQGGSVGDGIAIYNALRRRAAKAQITTRVDGYALSIASIIALAGDRRISPRASMWMMHKPWAITQGDSDDMEAARRMLDEHEQMLADLYSERTSLTRDDALAMMRAETWMRGDEAFRLGFATELSDAPAALAALHPSIAAKFCRIPEEIQKISAARNVPVSAGDVMASAVQCGSAAAKQEEKNMETKDQAATVPQNNGLEDVVKQIAEKINSLEARMNAPAPAAAPAPLAPGLHAEQITLDVVLRNEKCFTPAQRVAFICNQWNELARHYPVLPQAANTDNTGGALTPRVIADQAVVTLQKMLAPLNAYATNFSSGRTGRTPLSVPLVTAGGTPQTNPTNFEDDTNFVNTLGAATVTPQHVVAGAHLTNAEYQNGWTLRWVVEQKAIELGIRIKGLVNAQMTSGFSTRNIGAAASFGASDLKNVWALLKNASRKSIILDGDYFAQFLPNDINSFNPLSGFTYPGWDGFYHDNHWTGAPANTVGFACHPQAIAAVAALPNEIPQVPGSNVIAESIINVDGIGLSVASYMWLAPAGRVLWQTWELMFGAARADTSAGFVLTSA